QPRTEPDRSSLISQSILYADQVQAAGRRRRSCRGPLTGSKNPRDLVRRQSLLAHKDERPNQVTDHVMKKAVPADLVDEFVALRKPPRGKYFAHVGNALVFP